MRRATANTGGRDTIFARKRAVATVIEALEGGAARIVQHLTVRKGSTRRSADVRRMDGAAFLPKESEVKRLASGQGSERESEEAT